MRSSVLARLAVLALVLVPVAAHASWPTDPSVNVAVFSGHASAGSPHIIGDGAGGIIVIWQDSRTLHSAVYARRVGADGTPLWSANGVLLSDTTTNAAVPVVASDGAGGAIVAWFDARNGSEDVYAQRIDASGNVKWTAGGVPVALASGYAMSLAIVPDGAGGATCAWWNNESGLYRYKAQRVNATGIAQWSEVGGVSLTTRSIAPRGDLQIVPDGTGGLVGTWYEYAATIYETYAQRLDGSGAARWGADGLAMGTTLVRRQMPAIASDGAGGAIVAWDDYRTGNTLPQIYAQRFDANGSAQWTAGGVPFAPTGAAQWGDTLLADGNGGVFAVWRDARVGGSGPLYAQHLDALGLPHWTTLGVALDVSPHYDLYPELASDGHGGIVVAWTSYSGSASDIEAQSVSAAGACRWGSAGVPVTNATGMQFSAELVGDGNGGLTAAWWDGRSGTIGEIYAQHLGADGAAGSASVLPPDAPSALALASPWPSPVRAATAVMSSVTLPAAGRVRASIVDVGGRTVRTLLDASRGAGTTFLRWDTRDERGRSAAAGVYFLRVDAAGRTLARKIVLTR